MKKYKFIYCLIAMCFVLFGFSSISIKAEENINEIELGYFYTSSQTTFKLMSSSASKVTVVVEGVEHGSKALIKENNIWIGYVAGDLNGKQYSYTIEEPNGDVYENVLDPYGRYLNEEGTKNVICNESAITFTEWSEQVTPLKVKDKNKIIYGINVANFTSHSSWNGSEANRGKLLGLIESSTNTYLTGYDYVKSLGITYLELSNINDIDSPFVIDNVFVSGEEIFSGSLELKQIVNNYYLSNIGLIMTFNHEDLSTSFLNNLNKIDAGAYLNNEGKLDLNKSETQRYIKDLITYYVEIYKLSGVKLENMSQYTVDFINNLTDGLKTINSEIIVYGNGSYDVVDENTAGENNLSKLNEAKMINGSFSYSMFGDLNNKDVLGMLEGNYSEEIKETLKFALLSSVDNGEIDYSKVLGVSYKNYWGNNTAYQLVNYIGTNNGLSVYDKLKLNYLTGENIIKQKIILSFGTMMMSGGIPYIYSGEEFLMSYLDVENSGESICKEDNSFCFHANEKYKVIDWSYSNTNSSVVNAFKSLINYRKSSNSVAQTDANSIKKYVRFYENENYEGVIGFTRNYPNAYNRETEKIFVVFNYSNNDYTLTGMEKKGWQGLYTYNSAIRDGENIILKGSSLYIELKEKQPKINSWITLLLVLVVIGLLYYANIYLNKKLVEKKGYDINDVKKKYRPFVKRKLKKSTQEDETQKGTQQEELSKTINEIAEKQVETTQEKEDKSE